MGSFSRRSRGTEILVGQVPSGVLLDRFGTTSRSCLAIATRLVSRPRCRVPSRNGFWCQLLGLRLALGHSPEAPWLSATSRVVAKWFPRGERGRAIGVYTAAESASAWASHGPDPVPWILNTSGWRMLFPPRLLEAEAAWRRRSFSPHGIAIQPIIQTVSRGRSWRMWTLAEEMSAGRCRSAFRPRPLPKLCSAIAGCVGSLHRAVRGLLSTFVFFLTWFPTASPPNGT